MGKARKPSNSEIHHHHHHVISVSHDRYSKVDICVDLGVDGGTVLKRILRKCHGMMRSGFSCLRKDNQWRALANMAMDLLVT
jgi:hypothetical protein